MQERTAPLNPRSYPASRNAKHGWQNRNKASASTISKIATGMRSPFVRPPLWRPCARSFRAMGSCSSIPARIAPSLVTRLAMSRAPIFPPPILDRWAGRSRRRSVSDARSPAGVSPSSPAMVLLMHGLEVQTAARYGLPILYVVLNNGALGNVWLRARSSSEHYALELTTIPDHDWADSRGRWARSGVHGSRSSGPQREIFQKALAADGPVLIDIKADKNFRHQFTIFAASSGRGPYPPIRGQS